ncbi:nucleoplasmin-2 isoform X3 [Camelus ferus]|uniref:Nucleoplasmin-2 n=1 Tax=Camelus ferus TaxID=419612 RepID=A0A8B8S9L3_CAMFR|nr:nucleoplasmin-2 isoform X3 [Camelus ferus]
MNRSRTSSTSERAAPAFLWGCELNQEKPTWTFKAQKEGKQDCKLLLSTICLGEKAKEEMNLVEILPPGSHEDRKRKPIILASLRASVLPMVVLTGLELSPPVTFHLRAGSGPVFLSGQECYEKETRVKQVKRLAPQKQTSAAKKKKVEKEEEAARYSLKDRSPLGKAKTTIKPKKPGSKK